MHVQAWVDPEPEDTVKLKPPVLIDRANYVLIRDDQGQPLVILMQTAPGHIWFARAGDKDFAEALARLNIEALPMQVVEETVGKDIKFPGG